MASGIPALRKKKRLQPVTRHAEQPGQTVNVDLCFVPVTHCPQETLPAVSGSSGGLRIPPAPQTPANDYPGAVFADPEPTYGEQMQTYVCASQQRHAFRKKRQLAADPARAERQRLKQAATTLRMERQTVRTQRHAEDAAWQVIVQTWRAFRAAYWGAAARDYAGYRAAEQQWHQVRVQRQQTVAQRAIEDAAWRAERVALRTALGEHAPPTAWYAMLIIIDNCTRQSYGVPVLRAGAHVTSEDVRQAVALCLPSGVRFVISDRGTHFTAQEFQAFVQEKILTHVLTSRRRPQTNGIAERMVRTLKAWLREYAWDSAEELEALVHQFVQEYNDRPHQGKELAGLSPNAYTARLREVLLKCAKGS